MLEMPSEKAYGVAVENWRSTVDMPRDGTVIVVLYRDSDYSPGKLPVIRAEALMFGEDPDDEAYWYTGGDWSSAYDAAADLDPKIVGWLPLPQIAEWDWAATAEATSPQMAVGGMEDQGSLRASPSALASGNAESAAPSSVAGMVERVAQAIANNDEEYPYGDHFGGHHLIMARAAIAAMREPTLAMGAAAIHPATVEHPCACTGIAATTPPIEPIWRAMIDTALTQPKEG